MPALITINANGRTGIESHQSWLLLHPCGIFIYLFNFLFLFIYLFIFVVLNLVLELKLVFPPFHAHAHPNNFATISYFLGSIIGHFLGNK